MIQLHEVTKRFGSVTALDNVSLQIEAGAFVLLSGPSGAGKTTLLRTIFAAERVDLGQVLVNGQDIGRLRRRAIPGLRRSIGVVFQDFKLLDRRSALENVAVALEVRGLPPEQVRQGSRRALGAVGLADRADTPARSLSGGEQQRVAIARAMAGAPSILLCDEPTGNLDPERSHDILDLLDSEARRGTTVIVATHDPMVVQNAAAQRVVLMDSGMVVGTMAGACAPINVPDAAWPAPTVLLGGIGTAEVMA